LEFTPDLPVHFSSGNTGCYYKGKTSATAMGNIDNDIDVWTPALYGPTQSAFVTVTIRQAEDPFIYASFVTYGTFYFGEPYVRTFSLTCFTTRL